MNAPDQGRVGDSSLTGTWAVIPSHNTAKVTQRCVEHLLRAGVCASRIVVVDDASCDDTLDRVADAAPRIVALRQDPRQGFSAAANRGIEHALASGATQVLLINSDCFVGEHALSNLHSEIESSPWKGSGRALWSLSLAYPDGRLQWSGADRFPSALWLWVNASGIRRLTSSESPRSRTAAAGAKEPVVRAWVPATCWLIERSVWEHCGPFASEYTHYGQDLEFCWRARTRDIPVVQSTVRVVHLHGESTDFPPTGDRRHDLLWPDLILWSRRCRGRLGSLVAFYSLLSGGLLGCALDLLGRLQAGLRRRDVNGWKVRYDERARGLRRLFQRTPASAPSTESPN